MFNKILKTKMVASLAALAVFGTMAASPATMQTVCAEEAMFPAETNTNFSNAREITFGSSVAGTISASDRMRYYKFSLEEAGRLDLGFEKNRHSTLDIKIYDALQTEIFSSGYDLGKEFSLNAIYLTGGDYYMSLACHSDTTFSFVANFDSVGESFLETQDENNDMASNASVISLKKRYKGVLAQNDDIDYFKFKVPSTGKITINLTNAASGTAKYAVYDRSLDLSYTDTVRSNKKVSQPVPLKKGAYYLAVTKKNVNKGTGSYTFSIDYTEKISAAPKIKSLKNPYSGKMEVKWSRVPGATGYEVCYSTKSDFKKDVTKQEYRASTTSADFYGLSNKKYYVRIRAYEKINNVKQYGKWSQKKSVAIK